MSNLNELGGKRARPEKVDLERLHPEDGYAEAAKTNRQLDARQAIVAAYVRLGTPSAQWPQAVRTFTTSPQLQARFSDESLPNPFQPPGYDRLNQTAADWVEIADRAWEEHRNAFLKRCESWVQLGIDEPLPSGKRSRGPGRRKHSPGSRKRSDNVPIDKRYEWAARYLAGEPLKVIAGADIEVSGAGKAVKEILRVAGWRRQARSQ